MQVKGLCAPKASVIGAALAALALVLAGCASVSLLSGNAGLLVPSRARALYALDVDSLSGQASPGDFALLGLGADGTALLIGRIEGTAQALWGSYQGQNPVELFFPERGETLQVSLEGALTLPASVLGQQAPSRWQLQATEGRFNVAPLQAGLTIPQAIAAMTPGDPSGVDNPDEFIGDSEIRAAFTLWIQGQVVPGTDQTISDTVMRQLVQSWITGEQITSGGPAPSPTPRDREAALVGKIIPSLRSFSLVKLDPAALLRSVQAQQTIALPFSPAKEPQALSEVKASLRPANLVSGDAVGWTISGEGRKASTRKTSLPQPSEYIGEVLQGPKGSIVGFSLTSTQLTGGIWIPDEAGKYGWSFIEPLEPLLRENGGSQSDIAQVLQRYNHVVYNATGINIDQKLDEDEPRGKTPTQPEPDGEAGYLLHHPHAQAQSQINPEWIWQVNETLNVYLFSDTEFYNQDPATVWSRQRNVTLWVSLLYGVLEPGSYGNDEFDLPLNIVGQATWILGGPSSTDSATLLGQSYNMFPWSSFGINRNNLALTHFFTGKNIDGTTIGRAWKIGGVDDLCGASYATSDACQHSFSQPAFSGTTFYLKIILMAHEMGHVMGALHSDFDPSYTAGSWTGPTIMRSSVTGSQVPYFSATNADTIGTYVYWECSFGGDVC